MENIIENRDSNFKKRSTFHVLRLIVIVGVFAFVAVPFFVFAADPIVICGTEVNAQGVVSNPCTFNDFLKTIGGIVNGTLIVISVSAAISFMYARYSYLTSGGNQEKVSYAKGIFWKVFLGYIIILGAWAFVHTIEVALLKNTNSPANQGDPGTSFLKNN